MVPSAAVTVGSPADAAHAADTAVRLNGRAVGPGEPPFVIAEIGSNHNGSLELALRLIDAAQACGADAVKFQSWSKASLISTAEYARNTRYSGDGGLSGLEEEVERYQLTPAQHREIAAYCRRAGVTFLSSVFSPGEVELLDSLDAPAFKIASMDVTHLPLLACVARRGKPVLLSTGMATLGEIERALAVLRSAGAGPVILLHCVSTYPTPPAEVNLRNIPMLAWTFGTMVGYSDHTLGTAAALAAVALGACAIEKHFTLDRATPGWDHAISADPAELRALVEGARDAFAALGSAVRTIDAGQIEKRKAFRRRLVAARALASGTRLTAEDFDFKRPGTGIGPEELDYAIGRTLRRDLAADEEVEWTDFL
jgi:N-acetylneuraminate synthase